MRSAAERSVGPLLRRMQPDDLPQLMPIEQRVYPHPWPEWVYRESLREGIDCWVCEESDGTISGYAVMAVRRREAHIMNVCVRPESRGRGLGRWLLAHLLVRARSRRARTARLEVRHSNRAARRLYQAFGFREAGTRLAYYPMPDGREDALIMVCDLRRPWPWSQPSDDRNPR